MKVSDYIAGLLLKNGIKTVFSVVGGGAMHLNDSFGNREGLQCIYNHHEQASAMAAESYARLENRMAAVCVTTGPGGTNALTGVLCAWQDNIPMLVLSGQVRYETTVAYSGLRVRQYGEQEHDIVGTVKSMTKYAVTVREPESIRYHIEKAIYIATHGRRGPCWIDIPLDVQNAVVEENDLECYIPDGSAQTAVSKEALETAKMLMGRSRRPLIVAGSAIRTGDAYAQFRQFAENMGVPVVAATGMADLFPDDESLYYGNCGMIGGRAGNFIVNNCDCMLAVGCRLTFKHTGFRHETFAPDASIIAVDVDAEEQNKTTVHRSCRLVMDVGDFLSAAREEGLCFPQMDGAWIEFCDDARRTFPVFLEKFKKSDKVNPYFFAETLKSLQPDYSITVVGNACACDMARQCGIKKEGQRLWGNTNCGTMGYDLPAAIGAAAASGRDVCCITGDGSIQMNIQELQTIVHNKLPVKIFIHANGGYFAIVQTQENFFGRLSGCTASSGISMPDFEGIAQAYRMPYYHIRNHEDVMCLLPEILHEEGCCICEIDSDTMQPIEPRSRSRIENGKMMSSPFDDLYPFLPEDVYRKYADFDLWRSFQ